MDGSCFSGGGEMGLVEGWKEEGTGVGWFALGILEKVQYRIC